MSYPYFPGIILNLENLITVKSMVIEALHIAPEHKDFNGPLRQACQKEVNSGTVSVLSKHFDRLDY